MFGFDEKNKDENDKIKERELITEYHRIEELTLELSKRVRNIKEINKDQDNEGKKYKNEIVNLREKNIKLETEVIDIRKELNKVKDEKKSLIEELEGIKEKLGKINLPEDPEEYSRKREIDLKSEVENKEVEYSLKEIKNLLAYSEGKDFISKISIGSIKFMIKLLENDNELDNYQLEELEKHFNNAEKAGYTDSFDYKAEEKARDFEQNSIKVEREVTWVDQREPKKENIEEKELRKPDYILEEKDEEFEFIDIKNVKDFKLEDWVKLGKFDETYGIFANKDKQILNNIKMRIKMRIAINNSELSNGEQCLKKARNNGYEAYLISYDHWEKFLNKSIKEKLLSSVDLAILGSALRSMKKHGRLTKDQLISLKEMYRDVKDIISLKKVSAISVDKETVQKNDLEDLLILDEMKTMNFGAWNKIYMWSISKKVLSNNELKKLRDIKTSCIMGKPKKEELESVLDVYKKVKKTGCRNKELAEKISVERVVGTQDKPLDREVEVESTAVLEQDGKKLEVSILKKYKEELESITQDYIAFSQLAKMVDRDIFQVKFEMTDLGLDWHVGRGYSRKEVLEKLEEQLNIENQEENDTENYFEMKCGTFRKDVNEKITFKYLMEKGLKEGTLKANEVQNIDYDNEYEVSDYYEAVEELEDRGIRIETA